MAKADDFYQKVIEKNTFYYFNQDFEERYGAEQIGSLRGLLYNLFLAVKSDRAIQKGHVDKLLQQHNGLRAMLALNGFANEQLNRVITLARVINDDSLDELLNRKNWNIKENLNADHVSEWGTSKIEREVRRDPAFRAGIVNLFFDGINNPCLQRYLPPFELHKLTSEKLSFDTAAFLDTLVRYKEKGSYSGKTANNPEEEIRQILRDNDLSYKSGIKLNRFLNLNDASSRTMDFIVPGQDDPRMLIESSFLSTTSSGQGDKAKAMASIKDRLKTLYPRALFIGFVDGIGWYVRKKDLAVMVSAFDDVFTYHPDELARFRILLADVFDLRRKR